MAVITSWMKNAADDLELDKQHLHSWTGLVNTIEETDLLGKTVLDYGCGPGGFLRLLYSIKPFKKGIGIDVASQTIEAAKANANSLPIEYYVINDQLKLPELADIAFSHEVIFLLKDLKEHAKFIYDSLKPNGVYYGVTGCHTESTLWQSWKNLLTKYSNLPTFDHSPEKILDTFLDNGFTARVGRLKGVTFVPISKDRSFYPKVSDALQYVENDIIVFRFQKQA